jgi:hypothetical protein
MANNRLYLGCAENSLARLTHKKKRPRSAVVNRSRLSTRASLYNLTEKLTLREQPAQRQFVERIGR